MINWVVKQVSMVLGNTLVVACSVYIDLCVIDVY